MNELVDRTITISPESIVVLDRLQLTESSVLVFTLDTGKLPPQRVKQYLTDCTVPLRKLFPEPIGLLVLAKGTEFTVIEKDSI